MLSFFFCKDGYFWIENVKIFILKRLSPVLCIIIKKCHLKHTFIDDDLRSIFSVDWQH